MADAFEENVVDDEELMEEGDNGGEGEEGENGGEATPLKKDNEKILGTCSISDYEKAFHKIFLELLDYGKGLHNAKESFTTALLNTGSRENPQDVYEFMDLFSSRIEKIHIVKRLCVMLGLHSEMDAIINHEMELIYNRPSKPRKSFVMDSGGIVAGDIRQQ